MPKLKNKQKKSISSEKGNALKRHINVLSNDLGYFNISSSSTILIYQGFISMHYGLKRMKMDYHGLN